MIRAAALAAALTVPALAHADPPGMTPPVEPGSAPVYAPPPAAPSTPSSQPYAPYPQTYTPAPYSPYPAPPMGPVYEQPPARPGTPSYRALTLGADFAAIGLFFLAVDHESEDLLALSVGTYALGAPLAHVMKGRNGHALASVGMRLGFPLLGALIGDGLHTEPKCTGYYDDCYYDDGPSEEAAFGVVLGVGAAMVIDSVFLAAGDKPRPAPQPQWGPTVRASQNGFALGAAGTF